MNHQLLQHWLSAERRGRDAEAEEILFEVFGALPLALPSARFADRVLVGAGVVWSLRARAATAASLVMAGLAAAFLLPVAVGVVQLVTPGDVLSAVAHTLAGAAGTLDELFSLWRFVAGVREALWLVVATPPVALTLLLMTALAALAGRWLAQMLSLHRSPRYVQAF
jgi:hypothetical protein